MKAVKVSTALATSYKFEFDLFFQSYVSLDFYLKRIFSFSKKLQPQGFCFLSIKFKYFKDDNLFLHYFLIELHHGQRMVFVNL